MVDYSQDQQDTGGATIKKVYGVEGATTIYKENQNGDLEQIGTIPEDLYIEQRINETDTLESKFFAPGSVRDNIAERDILYIFPDKGADPLKFRVTEVEFNSDNKLKLEGKGIEVTLRDDQTERTVYDKQNADQIAISEVPSSQMPHGTIESAPTTTVRGDYDNDQAFVSAVASAVDYDYYISQKEADDYKVDYFNFVKRQGSSTTVKTFTLGDNLTITSRENDSEVLVNNIVGLGYGDGENQLEARMWDAGPQTLLTSKLNEGATSSLSVDDTTVFGAVNDSISIRVGSERINGQISDSTTISISSRAVNDYSGSDTIDDDHLVGCPVWLVENTTQNNGPHTPDNPASGTSIDTYGEVSDNYTNKKIIDRPTLELSAWRQLRNRRDPPIRIEAKLPSPTTTVDIGDQVKVVDDSAKTNNTFRVVGFNHSLGAGSRIVEVVLSNLPRSLVEEIRDIRESTEDTERHMQGATNINGEHLEDNCDNAHPLNNSIFLPNDVISINKFELTFKRESFRGYTKSTANESAHTHDLTVQHPSHSHDVDETDFTHKHNINDTSDASNQNTDDKHKTGRASVADNASISATITARDVGTEDYLLITANVSVDGSGGDGFYISIENTTWNDTIYNTYWRPVINSSYTITTIAPSSNGGDDIQFKVANETGSTKSIEVGLDVVSVEQHKHGLGFTSDPATGGTSPTSTAALGTTESTTSDVGSAHNHGLDHGIFEPNSEPDVDVKVVVDGNTVKTVSNVSVGQEITSPIDLKNDLSEPLTGEYHDIELIPVDTGGGNGGRSRLVANVTEKVFIESTS